jgi:vacuole morphology and inheritance protein 14
MVCHLAGLFNMLSDNSHETRKQADAALSEFLQEIKNAPSVDYGRMAEILVQRASSPDEFTRLTSITWVSSTTIVNSEVLSLGPLVPLGFAFS